ncbi:MAG: superoxide dismutase family protein [Lachnospiraceae bacterium]|jgi:Cu-Zn family superoxide dismutase|nr:superoxide dismutase family protein [Lachnospiraceae bacterium]MCI9283889.1 superoxide dismutase family protein [Lachnospiraceae bacterium]
MSNPQPTPRLAFLHILEENRPQAIAWLQGGSDYPQISGLVKFYDTPYGGILIETELFNLPNISIPGSTSFYALHIHEYGDCSQNFSKTGEHYNPDDQPHPWHSGDLLPLLGNQGYAWDAFYDKRFQIKDILNRSVILHKNSDDFITQPSGNSGQKIACGIIRSNRS